MKARQARSSWYGHILRVDEGNKVKQTMKMEDQECGGWMT